MMTKAYTERDTAAKLVYWRSVTAGGTAYAQRTEVLTYADDSAVVLWANGDEQEYDTVQDAIRAVNNVYDIDDPTRVV